MIALVINALVPQGVLYASFKYGPGETSREGNYTRASFRRLVDKFYRLKIVKLWTTVDKRADRKGKDWFNVLMKKIN